MLNFDFTYTCNYQFQLINIGSQYTYGHDEHAEFLCVVSREYGATLNSMETEPTDRAKVCF